MNKNRIRTAISLMACALCAIIIVQYYWVEGLYDRYNQRFDKDVRIALINTAKKILAEDISDNQEILQEYKKRNSILGNHGEFNDFKKSNHIDDIKHPFSFDGFEPIDYVEESTTKIDQTKRDFLGLMSDYFDRILALNYFDANVEINPEQINRLLTENLREREIEVDFDFAITDDQDQFVYVSDPSVDKVLYLKSNYFTEFVLLGGAIKRHQIHLITKKRLTYFISDIKPIIYILTIMILIIMGSFYYALRIIFNQKKLSEIKTDFINNMTHELKTPISTISLALEALLQFGLQSDPDRGKKYLEICKSENKRLGNMVENVLNAAAFQKGELKITKEKINLHDMLGEVVQNIEVQILKNNGYIKTNFESEIEILEVDKVHFTNIFFNLLDNANKYYRDSPKIIIKTYNDSSNIYIEISDEGIGMKKEDQNRIFDRFYRVPTGNVHNVKGYGLGLSYVYDVVKKHGGIITVNSEFGKGTTFKIKLSYGRED